MMIQMVGAFADYAKLAIMHSLSTKMALYPATYLERRAGHIAKKALSRLPMAFPCNRHLPLIPTCRPRVNAGPVAA